MPRKPDEKQESVSNLKARFTEASDFNLANQLQEAEYKEFYENNRNSRRLSSQDHKMSQEEHKKVLDEYLNSLSEIERKDAEFALQLQEELENEERLARENQAKEDEELARRLAQEDRVGSSGLALPTNRVGPSDETIRNNDGIPANEADLIDFGQSE
ncbi:unnamed protein product [Bursaphelenchus okinawaensis]|uniref:Coiled-coil domain-containing protein n=1 Tax=Bursaphelenchus okinawaensis TaxID=465554 RepID=A0A811K3H3_9BILA|nr:unnamed protein product [Bursaphelenchus okinawaensis]CAG9090584.1 unnamed protein product [Bursaphelenchus okinawaensis]